MITQTAKSVNAYDQYVESESGSSSRLLSAVPVTVADFLRMEEVQAGLPKVLAGWDQMDRAVRWVHIAEVPDIARLLKGGELILTTGVALPDHAAELVTYIQELAEAGASGLVVELVRRYIHMPRELVQAAVRYGMPLISLEREVSFVAITEAVHANILDAQLATLRIEQKVHRAFHDLATRATAGDVVHRMSELVHCPVIFENLTHKPLAVAGYSVPLEELLAGWEDRSRRLEDDHPGWFAATVQPQGQPCGRVVMLLGEPHGDSHRAVLDSGASALAVAWLLAGPPSALEHAAQRELIEDVAAMRCRSINEVYVRARSLGVAIHHRHLAVLCIRSSPPFCSEESASGALERTGGSGLVGQTRDDQVYMLVTLPAQGDSPTRLDQIAAEIRNGFAGMPEALAFGAKTLPELPALDDLVHAMDEADEAALSVLGSGKSRVVTVDDIDLQGLMRLLADDARLSRFVARELRPLWEYQELHGDHLLDILTIYLEAGGNKSVAAARSHLSRTAFYGSLERLTAILGRDLESPAVRTALHVAILASSTSGRRPPSGEPRS